MEATFNLKQIKEISTMLWKSMEGVNVLAIHGPMGSGKTTLVHAICEVLHVKDVVGSPTFSIINEYAYPENGIEKKLYHIDLYRLKDEQEAIQAGVEDCLYSGDKCLVEWPEKASSLLPTGTLHIYIEIIDDQSRKVRLKKN